MYTIVLGHGLSRDILSPEPQFQNSRTNVGQHEISRLTGTGKSYGRGPLPVFLHRIVEARKSGAPTGLILFQDAGNSEGSSEEAIGAGGSSFIEPLRDITGEGEIIRTVGNELPWDSLSASISRVTGIDSLLDDSHKDRFRFLIVGCETDIHILSLATLLRRVVGFKQVAVCSHLVGSRTPDAHYTVLRHILPRVGVNVLLDLEDTLDYAGLNRGEFSSFARTPCTIEPAEAREVLDDERRRIVELMCMHWTRVRLKPLMGGYSGSLLFIADGWKGDAHTEPMVVKIDSFEQMRREIDGYYQIKDFFGKHVPTFGHPVSVGGSTGVGMELAAMEGRPETLQDTFEAVDREEALDHFLDRLDKALALLSTKLHRNTSQRSWVVPYRSFQLHADVQIKYFKRNIDFIMKYLASEEGFESFFDPDDIENIFRLIRANEDGIESEVCLAHGDMNFQNIICDEADNIWFIDWTHGGTYPVELDYAKLENDVKFVMSKEFDVEDLPRLKMFEEYLVAHRTPGEVNTLPDSLKFARWDLRYRRILEAVRRIREACFSAKLDEEWVVYRIALLRYAMHNLSFDKRRDRGECDLPQLAYALSSMETLVYNLVADDFNLKIRAERPADYPKRLRISIDESPWALECAQYDPPYYVDPKVLSGGRDKAENGWADPETVESIQAELAERPAKYRDDLGRPLNPRGRTGLAGRGLLGRWGANPSVGAVVTRENEETSGIDVLLGQIDGSAMLQLPKGFALFGEDGDAAIARVMVEETQAHVDPSSGEVLTDGYTYDPRQTDHAWVTLRAYHFHQAIEPGTAFEPGGDFEEIKWHPLSAEKINSVPSSQARLIRDAVIRLRDAGRLDQDTAETLLAKTG